MEASQDDNWMPLESNPEVINNYVQKIGFDTSSFLFYDILGIEEWAQALIPQPALAVMLLYPIKEKSEEFNKEEEGRINKEGQKVSSNVIIALQQGFINLIGLFHETIC